MPGDRHLIVGLKDGKMLIVDVASSDILEEIPAHSKELWSVTLFPDLVMFSDKNILTKLLNIFFETNILLHVERSR